jgi:hypothetical protein
MVDYCEANDYDLIVSHHPIKINGFPQIILHTALDCTIGGLNDMWRDALGVRDAKHFDKNLGWAGAIDPIRFGDLLAKCEAYIGGPITGRKYADDGDDTIINSVVICTGLGGMVEDRAVATGADCWIFGEGVYASTYYNFKAFIEIGHTKSEKIGIGVVKAVLEPHGIQVDPAPDDLDWYGVENPKYPKTKWEAESEAEDMEYGLKRKKEWNEDPDPKKERKPMGKWERKPYEYKGYSNYKYPSGHQYDAYYDDYVWTPGEHKPKEGEETKEYSKKDIGLARPSAPGSFGGHPANPPKKYVDFDAMTEEEWQAWRKEQGYAHPINEPVSDTPPEREMTPAEWDKVFEGRPPIDVPPPAYVDPHDPNMTDEEWDALHKGEEDDEWLLEQGYTPEQVARFNKRLDELEEEQRGKDEGDWERIGMGA